MLKPISQARTAVALPQLQPYHSSSALTSLVLASHPAEHPFLCLPSPLRSANCHLRWDEINTGAYVAAFSDKNPLFESSCGMCLEIRCQNAYFQDGYGQSLDRRNSCYDENKSIYVTVADACPCNCA